MDDLTGMSPEKISSKVYSTNSFKKILNNYGFCFSWSNSSSDDIARSIADKGALRNHIGQCPADDQYRHQHRRYGDEGAHADGGVIRFFVFEFC